MSLIEKKALIVASAAIGLLASHGPSAAADPVSGQALYVLGPESAVGKAVNGGAVRACAPAVVSLPSNFEHLRTPPSDTAKAVALKICEVMIVTDADVDGAMRSLRDLDVVAEVAPLGAAARSPASATGRGQILLASASPAANLAATSSEDAEALFFQGYDALQGNRVDEAIALFERGLRVSPTNHLALFYLASAYESANEPAKARPLYERVTSLAPQSQEAEQARTRLAALRASGVAGRSGGRFSTGIFIDPSSPPEDRSIRDVFERSPMAAGDDNARPKQNVDLPPPPIPALASRRAPRIEAPAVPPDTGPRLNAMKSAEPPAEPIVGEPAADTVAETARVPLRPRLATGSETTGAASGRLSTQLGSSRLPAYQTEAVGPATADAAPDVMSNPDRGAPAESIQTEEARLPSTKVDTEAAMPRGPAKLNLGQGAMYLGPVESGRPQGQGQITYADGSSYEGSFESGKRSGSGVFASADGWRYEGEFVDDRFDGQGTLIFADGARYAGAFEGGKRTGAGVYTWASGARYEGVFVDGAIVGPGLYVAEDGTRYDGEFSEGRRTGKGTLTFQDGRIYVGTVANGLPDGRGNFYWPDGRRFAGDFRSGRADGPGIMVHADGRSESGTWTGDGAMADLVRTSQ